MQDLISVRARAKALGLRVVQCHGCFDIVHPGHVRHLRHARAQGDVLLVSITGDAMVGKGAGRPLIPEELRAENLAALDFVDWVYIEQRPTAAELLADVAPDVYVKGREYETNNDARFRAEREIVERAGGRVVYTSGEVVFSSTALIAAMEQSVDPYHKRLCALAQEPALQVPALQTLIAGFAGQRVLVVGETILDTYVMCDRPEVAGESPIMTLRPLERRQYDGGAAVIARHLAAMGASPVLVTALPEEGAPREQAEQFRQRMSAQGIEVRSIGTRAAMAEKQRFLVGSQKVMKMDLVDPTPLEEARRTELLGLAEEACDSARSAGCRAAIVADFGLGLLTAKLTSRICRTLRKRVGILAGDVSGRRSNLRAMTHTDLLAPSEAELRDAMRMYDEGLPLVTWKLLEETFGKASIVTMGADGLVGFDRLPTSVDGSDSWQTRLKGEHVPALCPLAVDPLGCGDALLSAATLALATGGSMLAASFLGACAAATQVQRLGNTAVSATDLRQMASRVHGAHLAFTSSEVVEGRRAVG